MLRLVSLVGALCTVSFGLLPRTAVAAAGMTSQPHIKVIINLAGTPLALNGNLKIRDGFTGHRNRLDPTLPASRLYARALTRYQNQEIAYLKHLGINLDVGYQYAGVTNGFSATIPTSQLPTLQHATNVVSVLPVHKHILTLDKSLPLINAPQAWSLLGGQAQAGRGVRIADLDTGIDASNPCFRDDGMPAPGAGFPRADNAQDLKLTNNKIIVARAFGTDKGQYSVDDQVGHGTFTSAIEACAPNTSTPIGAKISGVAPGAYLMVYNIFAGSSGGTDDTQVLGALNAALLDGADVINMSIGGVAGDPHMDPQVSAISAAVKAGVAMVISAGNEGPTPVSIGSPGVTPDAITVGASTNSRAVSSSVFVNGPNPVPEVLSHLRGAQGSVPWKGKVGPRQVVYVGLGRMPNDDSNNPTANDFAGKDLQGKIALIQRGTIFFNTKINNAEKNGAVGAIVFDNRDEVNLISMSFDVPNETPAKLPALFISQNSGQALLDWVKGHPDGTVTMDSTLSVIDETPNVLADFSSRGYGNDYAIKPDLVGPGQDIYAATENRVVNNEMYNSSGFALENGTSFSAPHVAGTVALVLQKHPTWTPAMVKADLMGSASSNVLGDKSENHTLGVMDMGAGLVDASAALTAPGFVLPSSFSFGLVNTGYGPVSRDATLTLSDAGSGSGAWKASVQTLHNPGGVTFSVPATVTLNSGGKIDLALHVSAPGNSQPGDYDGYVVLSHGAQSVRVPYFAHIAAQAVQQGSVLLLDGSYSRFQSSDPTSAQVEHVDVAKYYTAALSAIGKSYTYWNEAINGTPTVDDLKKASAVIYFTGNNLNGWSPSNSDPTALLPPLTPTDEAALRQYVTGGGKLWVTGRGAVLVGLITDWPWILLGGGAANLSLYDNEKNDKDNKGGISPPQPSAVPAKPDKQLDETGNPWLFGGMKALDFSNKGDGAGNNVGVHNTAFDQAGLPAILGVPGLLAFNGTGGIEGNGYGIPVLRTSQVALANGKGLNTAIASSDEPSFSHQAKYPGRTMEFSFGFESINDNTGYATRKDVLSRIFAWFDDHPSAKVTSTKFKIGVKSTLKAPLASNEKAAQYVWQVGTQTFKPTTKPQSYTFTAAGRFKIRAAVTDALGHVAVTPWATVTVGR